MAHTYIFFFSFAAFSVMLFQTILTRPADDLPTLDLGDQKWVLVAAVSVSALSGRQFTRSVMPPT